MAGRFLKSSLISAHVDEFETAITSRSISIAFSGTCAPSLNCLTAGLRPTEQDRIRLQYVNAIEWSHHAREELRVLPDPPTCIAGDLGNFMATATRKLIKSFGATPSIAQYERALLQRRDALNLKPWCVCHQKECEWLWSFLHIAGTPCTDFSSAGNCGGLETGGTTLYFYIWVPLILDIMPHIVISENVSNFPWGGTTSPGISAITLCKLSCSNTLV